MSTRPAVTTVPVALTPHGAARVVVADGDQRSCQDAALAAMAEPGSPAVPPSAAPSTALRDAVMSLTSLRVVRS
ncbi:hypothetical protein [Streptomyces sp. NPDC002889]|uniref:hypothetical protein n=1 Tax=Streptomyces sp. NPDC002889 TaxID=3364669 RepID=UPI00368C9B83